MTKPFCLYIHEFTAMVVRVFTWTLKSLPQPMAYLSKELDSIPGLVTLGALAAAALLVTEAEKLTG